MSTAQHTPTAQELLSNPSWVEMICEGRDYSARALQDIAEHQAARAASLFAAVGSAA